MFAFLLCLAVLFCLFFFLIHMYMYKYDYLLYTHIILSIIMHAYINTQKITCCSRAKYSCNMNICFSAMYTELSLSFSFCIPLFNCFDFLCVCCFLLPNYYLKKTHKSLNNTAPFHQHLRNRNRITFYVQSICKPLLEDEMDALRFQHDFDHTLLLLLWNRCGCCYLRSGCCCCRCRC